MDFDYMSAAAYGEYVTISEHLSKVWFGSDTDIQESNPQEIINMQDNYGLTMLMEGTIKKCALWRSCKEQFVWSKFQPLPVRYRLWSICWSMEPMFIFGIEMVVLPFIMLARVVFHLLLHCRGKCEDHSIARGAWSRCKCAGTSFELAWLIGRRGENSASLRQWAWSKW